jgi:hypothetical protein
MSEQKPIFDEHYVPSGPVSDTVQAGALIAPESSKQDAMKDVDEAVKQYGTNKPRRVITRVRKPES